MKSKKIAICFWGSFSREDEPQKNKLLTKDYINETAVNICTRTILNSLPTNVDLYSHSWTNWANETSLRFEDSIIENNEFVMGNALKCIDNEVKKLSKSKLTISEKNNIRFWNKQGLANQMSAAISRSRVLKLLEKKLIYSRVLF